MKAAIRAMIDAARHPAPAPPAPAVLMPITVTQYHTPEEVSKLWAVHPKTVKRLMQHETDGKMVIGNRVSTRHTRAKTMERYSAALVQRVAARLESGDDPRFQASLRN